MEMPVPSTVIAAYAEVLLEGRRVIVFGDAASGLAEQLVERGARIVHVYDQDAGRAAQAAAQNRSRNVTVAPSAEGDVGVRDGAFDVAIVEDVSAAENATDLLERVRRALSPRGTAIVASANPDARTRLLGRAHSHGSIGYYDLYDLVAAEFEHVRMLGQAPFAGYAVVDFAHEGDLELSIDTGFVPNGAEEPEWFIAMGSERPVELDAFAVIQLPLADLLPAPAGQPDRELRAVRAEHQALIDRTARMQAEHRVEVDALEEARRADRARSDAEVAALRNQVAEKESWIAELEARAAAADARADETLNEVERERREESGRIESLQAELADLEQKNSRLSEQLKEREQQLQEFLAAEEVAATDEYGELEAELKARGAEVRKLEKELRDAVRAGRELAEELARQRAAAPEISPELLQDVAALTATNARLAADLAAARWTIQELEDRLQTGGIAGAEHQAHAQE